MQKMEIIKSLVEDDFYKQIKTIVENEKKDIISISHCISIFNNIGVTYYNAIIIYKEI